MKQAAEVNKLKRTINEKSKQLLILENRQIEDKKINKGTINLNDIPIALFDNYLE